MAERIVQEESLITVADAIRAKGSTTDALSFPDGFKTAIEAIQAGGGATVKTGSVTFNTAITSSHVFVDDAPDIFILFSANTTKPEHNAANGIWAIVQIKKIKIQFTFGHNNGNLKYYVPYNSELEDAQMGMYTNALFNGKLLATTYNWIAIYGATL